MAYCFPVAALEGPDFSAVQFLEECHSRNPIANVHRDLVAFKRSLEAQLVAIIDKDYAEFLQLSLKLKGVNSAVSSLREPLQLILERVTAVQEAAMKMLQQNQEYLDDLGRMEQKKKELTLAITICEKLDLAERLLHIGDVQDDEDLSEHEMENVFIPVYDEEQSVLLERVARLVLEIESLIAQGADAQEPRLSVVERILREKLEAELATEIVPDTFYSREHIINVKNVNHLLRAYVIIQEPTIPEDMVARLLVQPFLDTVMTRSRLDGHTRGSCEGLPGIYSAVIEFVRKQLSGIVALPVCDACRKKNAVDILGQSIWKSIFSTLTDKLSEIYVAYNPDRIYHNYVHSVKFVAALENFCSNATSKEIFRELTRPFLEKWNMDVYFQLRYSELTQTMQSKRPQDTAFLQESISDYIFPMSKQVALASLKCFADGVHLDAQTPKFARLSLQLLHEYIEYWRTPVAKVHELACSKATNYFGEVNHSCVSSAEDVFALANDFHRVAAHIIDGLNPVLTGKLEYIWGHSEAKAFAQQLTSEVHSNICELEDKCWQVASSLVAEDCMKVLPAVRTIKGQYQMTNKPLPTTYSQYVPTILKPLDEFLNKWGVPVINDGKFAQRVVLDTCELYATLASELLKSAAELEESLKSRKLRNAASVVGDGISDTDKMKAQVQLDLTEFARIAHDLGADVTQSDAFNCMKREVAT